MTRKKTPKTWVCSSTPLLLSSFQTLCVCVSSNLFEPQLENSQEAQFSPILCPLQRQSQFSALDMEINTGAVHYGR
jgi:hypothetical protein